MPRDWVDPGTGNTAGYNPQPYRGRPTNSHKRPTHAGGGKPPKKGCCAFGRALIALTLVTFGAMLTALTALVTIGVMVAT